MATRSVTASGVIFVRSMFGACESVPSFGPHRSVPPQFCAADVPARNNINKKRPNCRPKVTRVRFIEIASGLRFVPAYIILSLPCEEQKGHKKNNYENVLSYPE